MRGRIFSAAEFKAPPEKNLVHLVFSGLAHTSEVSPNSTLSSSKVFCGVDQLSDALENNPEFIILTVPIPSDLLSQARLRFYTLFYALWELA